MKHKEIFDGSEKFTKGKIPDYLTQQEKFIFKLRTVENLTDKEIGEKLGISTNMATKKRKKIGFKIRQKVFYNLKY
ncbi:hypothetical protein AYK24_00015 [Thermoplasmatales archaeon SG8-52-4]|nr:MAG: hypothetical protein AYK24_00015 [Thermoplasmatales archaeon SG8-52-4]